MQFYDGHDARMRLSSTVIRVEDQYYHVNNVSLDEAYDEEQDRYINIGTYAQVQTLGESRRFRTLDLETVYIQPFKTQLGYVNLENTFNYTCGYYQRFASNQTRIGLSARNSGWYGNEGPNFSNTMDDPGFLRMLNNEYPTYREIMDNPLVRQQKTAFSRDFAIEPVTMSTSVLYFREERVGECNEDSILLYPNGAYLLESLQRLTNGVRIEILEE